MIPWIQVYSNLVTHPKTARLARELKLQSACTSPAVVASGIIVSIWIWAIQNAYSGDLRDVPDESIADACRWKKDPSELIDALVVSGFVDPDRKLHDWEEYSILFMDAEENKRERTRERVQRYRNKKTRVDAGEKPEDIKQGGAPCNEGVTVTQTLHNSCYSNAHVTACNASTIPDHTRPIIIESSKDSCANVSVEKSKNGEESMAHNSDFGRFWEAYPKKKSKATACKAFEKIRDTTLETMLAALEVQKKSKDWTKDGGQYIPFAATWLNQRRWEDEENTPATARGLSPEYYECGEGETL